MRAPSCRSMKKHISFRFVWHARLSSFLCLTICSNLPSGEASPLDDDNYKSVVLPRQNYLFDKTIHIFSSGISLIVFVFTSFQRCIEWAPMENWFKVKLIEKLNRFQRTFFCSIFAFVVFNETRHKSICLAEKMDWRENWKKRAGGY